MTSTWRRRALEWCAIFLARRGRLSDRSTTPCCTPTRGKATQGAATGNVNRAHATRFVLISFIFVGIQIAVLGFGWAALRMMDTTRAYATGESYYSKASNAAVLSLYMYAETGKNKYWDEFHSSLSITFGDREAREELDRTDPDIAIATAGYLQGRNDIADIPDAILVYRLFRKWGPFEAAIDDWRQGDEAIDRLIAVATELHSLWRDSAVTEPVRQRIIGEIDELNQRLTGLENRFSRHIASAARSAGRLVALVLCLVSLLLWSIGVALAWRTYRKGIAAEIRLRHSEERFRNFAEVASDWFWETGPDLRITYLSERFAKATGISPDDLLGRRARDATPWPLAEHNGSQSVATATEHTPFRGYMHRYIHFDGDEQYWNISGLPIFDPNGRLVGYRGTGSNVTKEIHAAQALREAKLQSDAANRAKSEFLANMSHELRTPLNAILGFSEITKDQLFGKASDKYTEYACDIFNSASLLLALIDDLLDLAKIEAGRMELYEEAVDVALVIRTTTEIVRQKIDATNLQLTTDVAADLPSFRADELKLKQIILNILSNAIKFTPLGGAISIAASCDDDDNLEIVIRDTGIGIAPDDIARALEPFSQIENSLTRTRAGTGLGLPLVKALTELHNGTLVLTSEVGRGTSVTITLPRERCLRAPSATGDDSSSQLVLSGERLR
jgi:PAS domain S-box-containing protein